MGEIVINHFRVQDCCLPAVQNYTLHYTGVPNLDTFVDVTEQPSSPPVKQMTCEVELEFTGIERDLCLENHIGSWVALYSYSICVHGGTGGNSTHQTDT